MVKLFQVSLSMYDTHERICSYCEKEFRTYNYEEWLCLECLARQNINLEYMFNYLKKNLTIEVDKDYDSYSARIILKLTNPRTNKDEEIASTSFSTRTEH